MKLYIFEGMDNTGKSTLIHELEQKCINEGLQYITIHSSAPSGGTNEEKCRKINQYNLDLCHQILQYKKEGVYDVIFLDRAWYSEYVYGPLYRKHDELDILANISSIEDTLKYYFQKEDDDIYLILLSTDDLSVCQDHEDGKSLSNNQIILLEKERDKFFEVFKASELEHKLNLQVNVKNDFADKEVLTNYLWSTFNPNK